LQAAEHGRLYEVGGLRVLELRGTPEEMGEAHGRLLAKDIRWLVGEIFDRGVSRNRWRRIEAGARVMERHQPERFRREMRSLAEAAGVDHMKIVALQLFGDAERGMLPEDNPERRRLEEVTQKCTTYAVFGPATRTGECIAGRNFDYFYEEVSERASIIIDCRPEGRRRFVTLSWAGVANGWTLMNDAGLVAANNSAFGESESLEGVSTCFMQRLVMEEASTVKEGIALVRRTPRAVGTAMLLAGGDPPDAVQLEYDHESLAVRRAHDGFVIASNGFRSLRLTQPLGPEEYAFGRYGRLLKLIRRNHGRIDRTMNFAAARGVPLESINLHCVVLFPSDLSMTVSMGKVPACREPFVGLRMEEEGMVAAR
jgi:hypothetical protein